MQDNAIPDDTGITAAELLAVVSRGWSTQAERRVVEFAQRRLTAIAEQVHKRLGSHCDKCGNKL